MVLRVAKQDSAFLYALLEGYEGIVNYSTLPSDKQAGFRDIYVFSTPTLAAELVRMVEVLRASVEFQIVDNGNFLPLAEASVKPLAACDL